MLFAARGVVGPGFDRMSDVAGGDQMPEVLSSLREAGSHHPDEAENEKSCGELSHAEDSSTH